MTQQEAEKLNVIAYWIANLHVIQYSQAMNKVNKLNLSERALGEVVPINYAAVNFLS